MKDTVDLKTLMANHGVQVIGGSQRTIAYTAVASGGTGLLNFTAAAHGLKKHQDIYIVDGAYAGIRRVKKVISANVFQVEGTFGATAAGNIELTAAQYGHGFIVNDITSFAIAEFEPEDSTIDPATIIAKKYVNNEEVPIPFKKIRLTDGDITVVRKTPPTSLPYTNR